MSEAKNLVPIYNNVTHMKFEKYLSLVLCFKISKKLNNDRYSVISIEKEGQCDKLPIILALILN